MNKKPMNGRLKLFIIIAILLSLVLITSFAVEAAGIKDTLSKIGTNAKGFFTSGKSTTQGIFNNFQLFLAGYVIMFAMVNLFLNFEGISSMMGGSGAVIKLIAPLVLMFIFKDFMQELIAGKAGGLMTFALVYVAIYGMMHWTQIKDGDMKDVLTFIWPLPIAWALANIKQGEGLQEILFKSVAALTVAVIALTIFKAVVKRGAEKWKEGKEMKKAANDSQASTIEDIREANTYTNFGEQNVADIDSLIRLVDETDLQDPSSIQRVGQQGARTMNNIQNRTAEQGNHDFMPDQEITDDLKKIPEQTEEFDNAVENALDRKKSAETTALGEGLKYIWHNFNLFKEDYENPKSKWERFDKMKQDNFKEIIQRLESIDNKCLHRYAKILRKYSKQITFGKLLHFMRDWIVEIEGSRKQFEEYYKQTGIKPEEDKIRRAIKEIGQIDKEMLETKGVIDKFKRPLDKYQENLIREFDSITSNENLSADVKAELLKGIKNDLENMKKIESGQLNFSESMKDLLNHKNQFGKELTGRLDALLKKVKGITNVADKNDVDLPIPAAGYKFSHQTT